MAPENREVGAAQTVPGRFAEHVRLRPDAVAVSSSGERLTFAELDAATDAFARTILSRCGAGSGRVALLMRHDAAACVAALGVVKAAKTLVVLNPRDPPAALAEIRRDADPALLVVDPAYRELALAAGFAADDAIAVDAAEFAGEELPQGNPDDLVALPYTSGSAGRPKAVMLPHRTVLHHLMTQRETLGVRPGSRVALLAPMSSSWGLETLWVSILNGAGACLFPIVERGVGQLAAWVREEEITELALATSVFRNVARTLDGRLESVRQVQLGAEVTRQSDFDTFWTCFPETAVMVNSLGSTECGALACHYLTSDMDPTPGVLPVGRACEGNAVLVLDENGGEVPKEEVGEIAVRSDRLPPGYWRDPALTAERFTPDTSGPGRLFLTRDLGRMSEDGLLTVVGRRDFRVKVRGQMVDLDDVEGAVATLPEVQAAAVHAATTPRGDTRLTAFVVAREGARLTARELRAALAARLSPAAIPAGFALLDSLPLTPQGKVDRGALARLERTPAGSPRDETPLSETEREVAEIWSQVFEIDQLGRGADFFELGGDSLTAAVIAAAVGHTFGVELELGAVVDSPTVADMAQTVERLLAHGSTPGRPPLTRASERSSLPLSFHEERTWNGSRTAEASARYTFAAGRKIEGPLDDSALRRALDHIVRRHEILRTTFRERLGRPVRVVHAAEAVDLPLIDVSNEADPEAEAHRVLVDASSCIFDLERPPLIRFWLVRLAPAEHHLIWAVQHVVSDEWSWNVFLDELRILYQAFREGRAAPLSESMPFQYGDFAAWQRCWLDPSSEAFRSELAWWREELRDVGPPPRLPFARTNSQPDARPSDGVVFWGLPPAVSLGLNRVAHRAGATFFMTRLAVFAAQLTIDTGQGELVLGTYATGRRQAALQPMMGFFSNIVTLRLCLAQDLPFTEALARVRARVVDASAHSDAPYGPLSEALAQETAVPPIQVIFGVRDQPNVRFAGLEFSTLMSPVATMPWEFSFAVDKHHEDTKCSAAFDAHVHHPVEVRNFVARYQRLAAAVAEHPERPVGESLIRA